MTRLADELLREMQSAVLPVDPPGALQQRRDRTIGRLQQLQSTVHGQRRTARGRRRATIAGAILAPFLAAGVAFALSKTHVQEVTDAPAPPVQSTPTQSAPASVAKLATPPVRVEAEPGRTLPPAARPEVPTRTLPKPLLASNASFPEAEALEKHGTSGSITASGAATKPTSTLSEENGLMERAMVASRTGDDRSALAILDTLLARFPRSVLREDAEAERLRALRRLAVSEVAELPPR